MAASDTDFTGKVAIVTGYGRENGIGAAAAVALAARGAAVNIHYVSESSASRVAVVEKKIKDAGGKVTVVQADISNPSDATKLVEKPLSAFQTQKIDIL